MHLTIGSVLLAAAVAACSSSGRRADESTTPAGERAPPLPHPPDMPLYPDAEEPAASPPGSPRDPSSMDRPDPPADIARAGSTPVEVAQAPHDAGAAGRAAQIPPSGSNTPAIPQAAPPGSTR